MDLAFTMNIFNKLFTFIYLSFALFFFIFSYFSSKTKEQSLNNFVWSRGSKGQGSNPHNRINETRWWFLNIFYFHPYLGKMKPFWLIFFKRVGEPTTNQKRRIKVDQSSWNSIWVFPKIVVHPKHPKMIIFSRKTHGFVGETHHFRKPPYGSNGVFFPPQSKGGASASVLNLEIRNGLCATLLFGVKSVVWWWINDGD